MLVIWNLFFCVSTVTEMMRPALSEFSNSTLKLLLSLHNNAIPLRRKKMRDLSSLFSKGQRLHQCYVFPGEVLYQI